MANVGNGYASPGVYTQTNYESSVSGTPTVTNLPVLIGTGNEILTRTGLEVVRGSSSVVDQRVPLENTADRAVVMTTPAGEIVLGSFEGTRTKFQVRNFPLVDGTGRGLTATKSSAVSVFINDEPQVVLSLDGANGIVELAVAPKATDEVRCTYYFNRTDTLQTDNLSDQVTSGNAEIRSSLGGSYDLSGLADDGTLILTVDGVELTITIPADTWTPSQIVAFINAGAGTTDLEASLFTNNLGDSSVLLSAPQELIVGAGTANTSLGFVTGSTTVRNKVFYAFNGPIVDGSNGGIITTDPAKVTVKVNGAQVVAAALDGINRAITLPLPPASGSVVEVTYFYNTWENTFDYLADVGVTNTIRAGLTPEREDYFEGADFVIREDKIYWGTSASVNAGNTEQGTRSFDETQISLQLADNRLFLAPCTAGSDSKTFKLPYVPTVGNGRNSPLGSDLFLKVSNGKSDVVTNRPDLVIAYAGYNPQDALNRGRLTVTRVGGDYSADAPADAEFTLKEAPAVGMRVYATFYHNILTDNSYTMSVVSAGASNVGSYNVIDKDGDAVIYPTFTGKGDLLANTTIQFPSGSELISDAKYVIPTTTANYRGAVEEVITVTFASRDPEPAVFVFGPNNYFTVTGQSDRISMTIDGSNAQTAGAGISLTDPSGLGTGFLAHLVSEPAIYEVGYSSQALDIVEGVNDELQLNIDGQSLVVTATAQDQVTAQVYVDAINAEARALAPRMASPARFNQGITITSGLYDQITFGYTGDKTGATGSIVATIAEDAYANANTVAEAVQEAVTNAVTDFVASNSNFEGLDIAVTASTEGRLVFTLAEIPNVAPFNDNSGFFEMLESTSETIDATSTLTVDLPPVVEPAAILIDGIRLSASTERVSGEDNFKGSFDVSATAALRVLEAPLTDAVGLKITIDGVELTGVDGARTSGEADFNLSLETPFAVAREIAEAINDPANGFGGICTATVGSQPVVSLTSAQVGADGNGIALTSTFTDPSGPSIVVGNDELFEDSTGFTDLDAFFAGGYTTTADDVAESIVSAINDGNNSFGGVVTASLGEGAGEVVLTSVFSGTAGNGTTVFLETGAISSTGDLSGGVSGFARDFNILTGFDVDAQGGTQTKLLQAPIARLASTSTTGTARVDRIVLRNRILPGSRSHGIANQTGVRVVGGNANLTLGLATNSFRGANTSATVKNPSLSSTIGFTELVDGQPSLKFYNGAGSNSANNQFVFTSFASPGVTVTVNFTASAEGTATPLGPVDVQGTILNQIAQAMVDAGLANNVAEVISEGLVVQVGDGFLVFNASASSTARLVVGGGSSNTLFTLTENQESVRTPTSADEISSALLNHTGTGLSYLLDPSNVSTDFFAGRALSFVVTDDEGVRQLGLESLTAGLGGGIQLNNAPNANALNIGTGLIADVNQQVLGADPIVGFFVTSNVANGSGSVNSSALNNGVGQDGIIGQTYVDEVTGFSFTILPAEGGIDYPEGATATLTFTSSKTILADANVPVYVIPGLQMVVTDTLQTAQGNTAQITTFEKGGAEPALGDSFFISYEYAKRDFSTQIYTKLSAVEASFGSADPNHPLSLAARLMFLNGASAIAIKQVPKAVGSVDGSLESYLEAIDSLEGQIAPNVYPRTIVPLTPATGDLLNYLARHCDVQSSLRFKAERTAVLGFKAGTQPSEARTLAEVVSSSRVRVVYPDMARINLTDAFGNTQEYLVDGRYVASALVGNVVASTNDVATPWTGKELVGFSSLARSLDLVEQNRVSSSGITVLEDRPPFLRVRHGLTTDMSNVLTRTPTVNTIADLVQAQARAVLERYIGNKFIASSTSQIEISLTRMFSDLQRQQIINNFTGITVEADPNDPTAVNVEAYYQPVFPLLYIVINFNVRAGSLS